MPTPLEELLRLAASARVYDLAQPYYVGMPHHPSHPPYLFALAKKHGDYVTPDGASSASEAITMGGHVGTHIDALCHFSYRGRLHGGAAIDDLQSYAGGVRTLTVDTIAPLVRRGILYDIAGMEGPGPLPEDFRITPAHLERAAGETGLTPRSGDVVLLRTGWAQYWDDPPRYISGVRGPGPELSGAQWLSGYGIAAAGSDTVSFEYVPSRDMAVHVHLLVEKGIHILEALDLEALARDRVYEFLFTAAPLKLAHGTGAPLRPLALVPSG